MPVKHFFPTSVYTARLGSGTQAENLRKELLKECRTFRELDEVGQKWSARHYLEGYTSYSSLSDLPDRSPTFEQLRKRIDPHAARFAKELDMDLRGRELRMTSCWINIMGYACHHSSHLHPLSAISGTYFVQIPKSAGPFKIEDPRLAAFMGSPPRRDKCADANRRFVDLAPGEGEILLFESWLRHEVPANRAKSERVSISFNYDWV